MTCLLNESISTLTSPCRSLDLAILIRERHCSISLATLRASKRSSFLILSFMNVDTISSLRRFDSSSSAILRSRYFTCKVRRLKQRSGGGVQGGRETFAHVYAAGT